MEFESGQGKGGGNVLFPWGVTMCIVTDTK